MKGKPLEMSLLFDFYGETLTEKQRELFDLYYNEDLSLAEIAEHAGITRQGVRDSIKRAEHALGEMEEKLGLVARYGGTERGAAALAVYTNGEFAGMPVITENKVGKGKVILLGSLPDCATLQALTQRFALLPASDNLVLTERTGEQNAIIAVETQGKEGVLITDGKRKDVLSGRTLDGSVSVRPYEVLVLVKE